MKTLILFSLCILFLSCKSNNLEPDRGLSAVDEHIGQCQEKIHSVETKVKTKIDYFLNKIRIFKVAAEEAGSLNVEDLKHITPLEGDEGKFDQLKAKSKTKVVDELYKYLRAKGFNLKIGLDADLGLVNTLAQKITSDILKTSFKMEYEISIKPDFTNKSIIRKDSIIISPIVSVGSMIESIKLSGSFANSYIFSHIRHYPGFLNGLSENSDDSQFVKPLRQVLNNRPIFFKPFCSNEAQENSSLTVARYINIPFNYASLDQLLLKNDILVFQKNNALNLSAGIAKVNNVSKLNAAAHRTKVLSQNLVIKKKYNKKEYYDIKTFFTMGKERKFNIQGELGLFTNTNIISWDPIDKLLKKSLRFNVFSYTNINLKKDSFLYSFILAPDLDELNNKSLNEKVKRVYDDFILQNYYPSFQASNKSLRVFYDIGVKGKEIESAIYESVAPLMSLNDEVDELYKQNPVPVAEIYRADCDKNKIKLLPFVNYAAGKVAKKIKEARLKLGISVLNRYFQNKRGEEIYNVKLSDNQRKKFKLNNFSSVSEGQVGSHTTRKKKEAFVITRLAENSQAIDSLATIGYQYILEDSKFKAVEANNFLNDLRKLFPTNQINQSDTEGRLLSQWQQYFKPIINSRLVQLSYRFLINPSAFELISENMYGRYQSSGDSPKTKQNPFQKYLAHCISSYDPNYNNVRTCFDGARIQSIEPFISFYGKRKRGSYFDVCNAFVKEEFRYLKFRKRAPNRAVINDYCDIGNYLMLIFTPDSEFLNVADELKTKYKRFFSLSKFDEANIPNLKMQLLNYLVTKNIFFKDIAPSFIMYLLSYNVEGSDLDNFKIDYTDIKQHLSFVAKFRSTSKNYESPLFTYGEAQDSSNQLLKTIGFFNFQFEDVFDDEFYCDKESDENVELVF